MVGIEEIITLILSWTTVIVALLMQIHTIRSYSKKIKSGVALSKSIFAISFTCILFAQMFALNEGIILLSIVSVSVTQMDHICIYLWLNTPVYLIAKGFMYLSFLSRFVINQSMNTFHYIVDRN